MITLKCKVILVALEALVKDFVKKPENKALQKIFCCSLFGKDAKFDHLLQLLFGELFQGTQSSLNHYRQNK